ncbi:MAG: M10 family metallopeptidase C-terminal domain-containing protein [Magnetospirillum sp.]|nr:M10 family metallopeptidase C-terminal domain-containing protein [Magnetospirillum sp.]
MASQDAIGKVETLAGTVGVTHADGSRGTLEAGAPVFEGDQLRTEIGGSVGLTFADGTTFALGEKGRLTLDEMVYDPGSKQGQAVLSVDKGAFTLVSGEISKTSPDALTIKTPTMTVGIRGTSLTSDGRTMALMSERGGVTGELSIRTASGQSITVNQAGAGVSLSPSGSLTPVNLTPAQIAQVGGNSMAALPNFSGALSNAYSGAASSAAAAAAAAQALQTPPKPPEPQKSPTAEQIVKAKEVVASIAEKLVEIQQVVTQKVGELKQKIEQDIKKEEDHARHFVEEVRKLADDAGRDAQRQAQEDVGVRLAIENLHRLAAEEAAGRAHAAYDAAKALYDQIAGKVTEVMTAKVAGDDATVTLRLADITTLKSGIAGYLAVAQTAAADAHLAGQGYGSAAAAMLSADSYVSQTSALNTGATTSLSQAQYIADNGIDQAVSDWLSGAAQDSYDEAAALVTSRETTATAKAGLVTDKAAELKDAEGERDTAYIDWKTKEAVAQTYESAADEAKVTRDAADLLHTAATTLKGLATTLSAEVATIADTPSQLAIETALTHAEALEAATRASGDSTIQATADLVHEVVNILQDARAFYVLDEVPDSATLQSMSVLTSQALAQFGTLDDYFDTIETLWSNTYTSLYDDPTSTDDAVGKRALSAAAYDTYVDDQGVVDDLNADLYGSGGLYDQAHSAYDALGAAQGDLASAAAYLLVSESAAEAKFHADLVNALDDVSAYAAEAADRAAEAKTEADDARVSATLAETAAAQHDVATAESARDDAIAAANRAHAKYLLAQTAYENAATAAATAQSAADNADRWSVTRGDTTSLNTAAQAKLSEASKAMASAAAQDSTAAKWVDAATQWAVDAAGEGAASGAAKLAAEAADAAADAAAVAASKQKASAASDAASAQSSKASLAATEAATAAVQDTDLSDAVDQAEATAIANLAALASQKAADAATAYATIGAATTAADAAVAATLAASLAADAVAAADSARSRADTLIEKMGGQLATAAEAQYATANAAANAAAGHRLAAEAARLAEDAVTARTEADAAATESDNAEAARLAAKAYAGRAETVGLKSHAGQVAAGDIVASTANATTAGGAGADLVIGTGGAEALSGGVAADTFRFTAANKSPSTAMDTIADFVSGTDRLEFEGMAGVTYDASPYTYTTSVNATVDAIKNAGTVANEIVFFSDGTDGYLYVKGVGTGATGYDDTLIKLSGATTAPVLGSVVIGGGAQSGTGAADVLSGGIGIDTLIGGAGADTLTGGSGADVFRYTAKTESNTGGMDVVTDFQTGVDKLQFTGMAGVAYSNTAYTYAGTLAETITAIRADAATANTVVWFTDGASGYVYVHGAGSGTDFDGSLVKLADMSPAALAAQFANLAADEASRVKRDADAAEGSAAAAESAKALSDAQTLAAEQAAAADAAAAQAAADAREAAQARADDYATQKTLAESNAYDAAHAFRLEAEAALTAATAAATAAQKAATNAQSAEAQTQADLAAAEAAKAGAALAAAADASAGHGTAAALEVVAASAASTAAAKKAGQAAASATVAQDSSGAATAWRNGSAIDDRIAAEAAEAAAATNLANAKTAYNTAAADQSTAEAALLQTQIDKATAAASLASRTTAYNDSVTAYASSAGEDAAVRAAWASARDNAESAMNSAQSAYDRAAAAETAAQSAYDLATATASKSATSLSAAQQALTEAAAATGYQQQYELSSEAAAQAQADSALTTALEDVNAALTTAEDEVALAQAGATDAAFYAAQANFNYTTVTSAVTSALQAKTDAAAALTAAEAALDDAEAAEAVAYANTLAVDDGSTALNEPATFALGQTQAKDAATNAYAAAQAVTAQIQALRDQVAEQAKLAEAQYVLAQQSKGEADTYQAKLSGNLTDAALASETAVGGKLGTVGVDTLVGNGVDEMLVGGGGADSLTGDGGADTFRFTSATDSPSSAPDTITDFTSGTDFIQFKGAAGLTYSTTAFTYTGASVTATVTAIRAASANNVVRFFTDGTDGYLYVKGAGTGTSFDDTLIKLSGKTTAPAAASIVVGEGGLKSGAIKADSDAAFASDVAAAAATAADTATDTLETGIGSRQTVDAAAHLHGVADFMSQRVVDARAATTHAGERAAAAATAKGNADDQLTLAQTDDAAVQAVKNNAGATAGQISQALDDAQAATAAATAAADYAKTAASAAATAAADFTTVKQVKAEYDQVVARWADKLTADAAVGDGSSGAVEAAADAAAKVAAAQAAYNTDNGLVATNTAKVAAAHAAYDAVSATSPDGEAVATAKAAWDAAETALAKAQTALASASSTLTSALTQNTAAQNALKAAQAAQGALNDWTGKATFNGGGSADTYAGSSIDDRVIGGGGADTLTGGSGGDLFRYTAASDSTAAAMDRITDFTSGTDKIQFENAAGLSYSTTAYTFSSTGADVAAKLANTITAVRADGTVANKIVFFTDGTDGYVYVNGAGTGTGTNYDETLIKLTNVRALPAASSIVIGGGAITGDADGNALTGSAVGDTLVGAAGADTLTGGDGKDVFRYTANGQSTAASMDVIADFVSGTDKIDLQGIAGITYSTTPFAWNTSVAATIGDIDAAALATPATYDNRIYFFTGGGHGYLYVKGTGSAGSTSHDGTVIKLQGVTSAPTGSSFFANWSTLTNQETAAQAALAQQYLTAADKADAEVVRLAGGAGALVQTSLTSAESAYADIANRQAEAEAAQVRATIATRTDAFSDTVAADATSASDNAKLTAAQLVLAKAAADNAAGALADGLAQSVIDGYVTAADVAYAAAVAKKDLAVAAAGDAAAKAAAARAVASASSSVNVLAGTGAADTLSGANGTVDILVGGAGGDSLTGGTGADYYRYTGAGQSTQSATDTIVGFENATDKIQLVGMAGVGTTPTANGSFGSVALAVSDITTNGANNQVHFFTVGADGYVYVKGAGTGTSFDGTLVKLAGIGSAPDAATFVTTGQTGVADLTGGAGIDIVVGTGGADTLSGGASGDFFRLLSSGDSAVTVGGGVVTGIVGIDTITGFQSGVDRIHLSGMAGVAYGTSAYALSAGADATAKVIATVNAIRGDTTVSDKAVFFTDATDGYFYVKGAGTGTSFDGTLVKLAGITSIPPGGALSGWTADHLAAQADADAATALAWADAAVRDAIEAGSYKDAAHGAATGAAAVIAALHTSALASAASAETARLQALDYQTQATAAADLAIAKFSAVGSVLTTWLSDNPSSSLYATATTLQAKVTAASALATSAKTAAANAYVAAANAKTAADTHSAGVPADIPAARAQATSAADDAATAAKQATIAKLQAQAAVQTNNDAQQVDNAYTQFLSQAAQELAQLTAQALANAVPNAVDDTKTVPEDAGATTVNVLSNDKRTDGGALDSATIVSVTNPGHGTATISGGNIVYTPTANYNGADSFTYTIKNTVTINGQTVESYDTATVTLTVTAVNDAPTAAADYASAAHPSTAVTVGTGTRCR